MAENDKKRSYDWNMHYGSDYISKQKARELRANSTEAEVCLWKFLRNRKLGYKFRRQHSIGIYIADFYSHELKLVIEVDGEIHSNEQQMKWDKGRTMDFNLSGIEVLRFNNNEVLKKRTKCCKESVKNVLNCL